MINVTIPHFILDSDNTSRHTEKHPRPVKRLSQQGASTMDNNNND